MFLILFTGAREEFINYSQGIADQDIGQSNRANVDPNLKDRYQISYTHGYGYNRAWKAAQDYLRSTGEITGADLSGGYEQVCRKIVCLRLKTLMDLLVLRKIQN